MLTVKHNVCIVDNTVCFSFHTWFAFNSICFCLELVKILPSWNTKSRFMFWWWKGKSKAPLWKNNFSGAELFHRGFCLRPSSVLLNNSHWTNCLGCWILLFTSIEKCCVCMLCISLCVSKKESCVFLVAYAVTLCLNVCWANKVVSMPNAFGKSLWPLMMGQWAVSAVS